MKKLFLFLLIIVLIVFGAAQFFLPAYISSLVEKQVTDALHPQAQTLTIQSSPAAKMLLGRVDSFSGDLEKVKLGDLTFDNLHLNVTDLEFNPIQLATSHKLEVTNIGSGELDGVVTEQALTQFMEEKVKGLEVGHVSITPSGVDVVGDINIGGIIRGEANARGVMEIKNNTLAFAPQQFSINGVSIGGLTSAVLKEIIIYDFANFPIPVKADRIESENGQLHVYVKAQAK